MGVMFALCATRFSQVAEGVLLLKTRKDVAVAHRPTVNGLNIRTGCIVRLKD